MSNVSELIEKVADLVVSRNLGVAAVFLLESGKPFTTVGSQFLIFLDPLIRMVLTVPDYQLFIELLADREQVERLICAVEARMEDQRAA